MDAWNRIRRLFKFIQPSLSAALAVLLFMTLLLGWVSICGTSALASAAWCGAVAAGAAVSGLLQRMNTQRNLLSLTAGVAAVLSAVTAPVAYEACLRLGVNSGLPQIAVWFTAALPAFVGSVAGCLLFGGTPVHAPARRLGGIVAGAAVFASHIWLTQSFAVTAAVLASCVSATAILEMRCVGLRTDSRVASGGRTTIPRILLNIAAGLGLVAGTMVLNRVFALTLIAISVSTALSGIVLLLAMLPVLRLAKRPWIVWVGSVSFLALLPWCYPLAIGWNLHLRATTSTGMGMVLYQGLQLAIWFVPVILATIAGCQVNAGSKRGGSQIHLTALFAGAAIAFAIADSGIAPIWSALAAIAMIAGVPAGLLWLVPAVTRGFRSLRLIGSICAVAAVAGLVASPPNLASASRLLFTMRPLAAVHRGVDQEMIPETDAVRMIASYESGEGTMTTWKIQADTLELRLNGHQVGAVSTNTLTTPQPAAEVLTCVLPLVLHPHATTVLLLDDYSGMGVETCEQFPLHRVVVVEPKALRQSGRIAARSLDQQTQILSIAPEAAIRDNGIAPVDVVISILADPMRSACLSRLSTAWFQAASERLTTDGVFCQRIRQQHIGEASFLQVLGRASAVFKNVAVVQLVPGELAMLASNSEVALLDEGVLARMERQHVRRQLSRCGWDWCQLAALAVVDSADPIGLWTHHELLTPSTATTGIFGLRLGWETVQPAKQGLSFHQLLGPHQLRIAEAVPNGPTHDEFRRRISAYAQQVEVLTAFPDEPWIYRKSLKSEMQRNQRPPKEIVVHGEIHRHTHPLDEHRKDYFRTLGGLLEQVRAGELPASELQRLSDFSVDYEPLISDFAHHELVRIHELADHPSPRDEFQHRLHTIYYTQPGDYSVRNVVAALGQLTGQPELMTNEADRFDQLNNLVQQLILRWEARTGFEPRSAVRMQRDVELSVQTVQTALSQMEQLAASAGKDRQAFLIRRQFVSQALIGPLRDYEKRVLQHRAKHDPLILAPEELNDDVLGASVLPMLLDQHSTN